MADNRKTRSGKKKNLKTFGKVLSYLKIYRIHFIRLPFTFPFLSVTPSTSP